MKAQDKMPTAGRLVAALGLAAVAWYASQLVRGLMPEDTNFGYFDYVNVGLALIFGWTTIGKRLGRGLVAGMNAGVTGAAVLVFWALFAQAAWEMLDRSMNRRYDGPFEAIVGLFDLFVEYGAALLDARFIAVLLGGAILVGLVSELVAKRRS